jgi:carboxylesterase type B
MVYIRDGFFQIPGRGNEYGFQYFMDENVVLVEFAYRLGAFGEVF